MDELVAMVAEKVGIPSDKASMAVQLVISHLKDKAPALSSHLDGLLGGGSAGSGGLGDVAGKLGGLMGGGDG